MMLPEQNETAEKVKSAVRNSDSLRDRLTMELDALEHALRGVSTAVEQASPGGPVLPHAKIVSETEVTTRRWRLWRR